MGLGRRAILPVRVFMDLFFLTTDGHGWTRMRDPPSRQEGPKGHKGHKGRFSRAVPIRASRFHLEGFLAKAANEEKLTVRFYLEVVVGEGNAIEILRKKG